MIIKMNYMTIDSGTLNCYNPLSFKFCAVCIGIAMYFVAVIYFQPCEPRTDFLLPCLFFHLDKFFSKCYSGYTGHKSRNFVTGHFSEICNCFTEVNFFSDMAWIAQRCVTCCIISIFDCSRLMSAREFSQ